MPLKCVMTCSQRLRTFEELVSHHQHHAIARDLKDLMSMSSDFESETLPTDSSALSVDSSFVCQVQFKHVFRNYKVPEVLTNVSVGEFVIVQSFIDKSQEDLGVVTCVYSSEEFTQLMELNGPFEDADENKVGSLLRRASLHERQLLPLKSQQELPLLRLCQSFIDRILLPMTVYGVEYQFDGNLLYVYYVSRDRVDFRPLVRFLSKQYCKGIRIQMKKTNQCREFVPFAFAAEALSSGQYQLSTFSGSSF